MMNYQTFCSTARFAGLCLVLSMFLSPLAKAESNGMLRIAIRDAKTGELVRARVEIRGADEAWHVAEDALAVGGDCDMSDEGAGLADLETTLASFSDRIENPYTRSTQFYSGGTSSIRLPAGTAQVAVFKGPEFKTAREEIDIAAGETLEHEIQLERWIDMPANGWYSADDHLHIPRPDSALNPYILKITEAEDIHVANLLQMGKVRNFEIAKQHAHGPAGHYQQGNYMLAAGQENPRTHYLGHTITLGADAALNDPDKYLIYRRIWEEAAKQGGINGYSHAFMPNGGLVAPHDGMAVILPHELLHFAEVLQFNRSGYEAWYDILNLGFRVTPTAGTDYPCAGQTIPGHERFYTKIDGPLTYAGWLESVRNGRTFVTTGPMLEFRVDGKDIGSEIMLEGAATVRVEGAVTFDPDKDDVAFIELIQNGQMISRASRAAGASRIEIDVKLPVGESSWFALRGYGSRLGERSSANPFHFSQFNPTSSMHTAPVYVSLKNGTTISESAQARQIAKTWLARLEDMERTLAETNMKHLAQKLAVPDFDAVPEEVLMTNRDDLLAEIEFAKDFFGRMAGGRQGKAKP